MPILHRRILPCLAPSCCCRWRPPRWPSRRRRTRRARPRWSTASPGAPRRPSWPASANWGRSAISRPNCTPPPAPPCRRGPAAHRRPADLAAIGRGCAGRTAPAAPGRQGPDARRRVRAQRDARVIARDRADATADRAVWRALYSPNQLQEQMTWFWMNHFNVYAPRATWAPSSAAMKTAPSGRTRWASSATCWPRPSARRPCCCTWTTRRTRPARSTRTMRAS